MKTTKAKRKELKESISKAREQLNIIKNDDALSPQGKQLNSKPVIEAVRASYTKALNEMVAEQKNILAKVAELKPKVDPVQVANRASVLNAFIANLEGDKLVKIYRQRFDNPLDRELIEELASVIIDTSGETGKEVTFIEKFNQAKAELEQTLPEYPKQLELLSEVAYIDNVVQDLDFDIQELSGKQIRDVDSITRRTANFEADSFEQNYTQVEPSRYEKDKHIADLEQYQEDFFAGQQAKIAEIEAKLKK